MCSNYNSFSHQYTKHTFSLYCMKISCDTVEYCYIFSECQVGLTIYIYILEFPNCGRKFEFGLYVYLSTMAPKCPGTAASQKSALPIEMFLHGHAYTATTMEVILTAFSRGVFTNLGGRRANIRYFNQVCGHGGST